MSNITPNATNGSISGQVRDDDGNPLVGVTIELLDVNSNTVATTTTDAIGNYVFTDLVAGDYTVVETNPADHPIDVSDQDELPDGDGTDGDTTVDNSIGVTVADGENDTGNNFVNSDKGSISGQVRDDNVNPLTGVTVTLLDLNDSTVATTTTDASGNYSFTDVEPGDYTVVETNPVNYLVDVSDQDGSPDGDAADGDTTVDNSIGVTVTPGEDDTGNDFVNAFNASPTVVNDAFATDEDTIINLDVLANDSDPEGDSLLVTQVKGTTVFPISLFPGVFTPEGAVVTGGGAGSLGYDPTYFFPGFSTFSTLDQLREGEVVEDTFTYTVQDSVGNTSQGSITVTVTGVNDAPRAPFGLVFSALVEDTGVATIPFRVVDPDHDISELTFSIDSVTEFNGAPVVIQNNNDGTFSVDTNTELQALKAGEQLGVSVIFTATDPLGAAYTADGGFLAIGVNDVPDAVDDTASTSEDSSTTINVLSNDTDVDGDPLSVFQVNGMDASVGSPITLASGALLTLNADGTFDYNPNGQFENLNQGQTANDSFTYTVTDGQTMPNPAAIPYRFDLSSLDGTNGFVINGIDRSDESGYSVSNAGDINGDGIGDVIIGARFADPNGNDSAGESYVVFGSSSGFGTSFELSSLNGSNGFVINGIDGNDFSGQTVSSAGDVNGDGIDDVIIGAYGGDPNGGYSGESYVVFGSSSGFGASLELSALNGSNGFTLNGIDASDSSVGSAVSNAGDVNGDGIGDLIIGASRADPNGNGSAGESYVVFGSSSGFSASLELSSLNGSNGFVLNGIDGSDYSGRSVSGAGDVNGDGIDDLIIGANGAAPNGSFSGESYVVFGSSNSFAASLELSSLNGTNGFVVNGIDAGDGVGRSVSGAGDINGDGIGDLIIGAPYADPNGDALAGESYIVFGSSSGFGPSLELSSLDGSNGFVLNGIDDDDWSGFSVSGAGDVNGDGIDDVIIGAYNADPNGGYSGESYVLYGRPFSNFPQNFQLSWLDGFDGFVLNGIDAVDRSGVSVSGAGDINGDGLDDLIIGANGADPNGNGEAGETYVVFGQKADLPATDTATVSITINGADEDQVITGDDGPETLTGGAGNDLIDGLGGNDTLDGQEGNDTLIGGTGVDRLLGRQDDDTLRGGADADTLNGGGGTDTADYTDSGAGVDVRLGRSGTQLGGDAQGDLLVAIENVIGSASADTLIGNNLNNVLNGLGGNDNIVGKAGNDTLIGGSENDTLDGNEGNDVLQGDAGNDRLLGRQDNDTLIGGEGADTLNGGGGIDTLDYSASNAGVDVNLNRSTGLQVGGHAEGDITNATIENIIGSTLNDILGGRNDAGNRLEGLGGNDTLEGRGGDDTLLGGADNDTLDGGTENDVLDGGEGDDRLFGRQGNDMLTGGAGADTLNGGSGIDTIDYSASGSGIDVNLNRTGAQSGGDAEGDITNTNIENVIGSGFADTLVGVNTVTGNNVLEGRAGNDTLNGRAGADTLVGGAGSDTLTGGTEADVFVLGLGEGTDTILDFQDGVDQIGLGGGLTFLDLTIGVDGSNATITHTGSSELLAVVTNAAGQLDQTDFIDSFALA